MSFTAKAKAWIERHPLLATVASFAVLTAPQWVASVWALFSSEPFIPWLIRHNVPHLAFSGWWITGPIGGLMFTTVLWLSSARSKKNSRLKEPKEPQPVIVAIDELKTLQHEGERLVNRFQIDSVKPTLGEVENWRKRMRECARQKILATENLVSAKDLLKLDKRWDEGEVLRITAKFVDHGCFADGSVEMAVFQSVWGHVQRLRELIAKIETDEPSTPRRTDSESRIDDYSLKFSQQFAKRILSGIHSNPKVALQLEGSLIGARVTNPSKDSEIRVEDMWIASLDEIGKKTEARRIRKYKFKRCKGMPHVMPARSSFEVTFLYGENAFRSFAQAHPKGPAQTEYWVEVKLEDGTIVPSDHKNLTSAQPQPGNRPKLILLDQGVSINPDGGTCFFFTVKNVGDVSVKKADFSFVIQTERLAKPPVVQHESTSQPIIEGTQRTIRYSFPKVDPEPAYIAFYISYIEDGQETRWDSPPVFLVWRGVKENVVHLELEYLRDEEINRFKEYLRKHELPKPLL